MTLSHSGNRCRLLQVWLSHVVSGMWQEPTSQALVGGLDDSQWRSGAECTCHPTWPPAVASWGGAGQGEQGSVLSSGQCAKSVQVASGNDREDLLRSMCYCRRLPMLPMDSTFPVGPLQAWLRQGGERPSWNIPLSPTLCWIMPVLGCCLAAPVLGLMSPGSH